MIRVGLNLHHGESRLDRLIAGHVARHAGLAPGAGSDLTACFQDNYFGLSRASVFTSSSETVKNDIRRACAQALMEEAYFIEKAGLAFGARMLLESDDTATRQTYALLTGDEATHLAWISPYVSPARREACKDEFLRLMETTIAEGPCPALVFIMQVILEGWGLDHYRRLADATCDENLKAVFRAILKDEAQHHRAGTLMLAPAQFTPEVKAFTVEALGAFLQLVARGPMRVIAILAQAGGESSAAGLAALHEQLGGEDEAARKLNLLCGLMEADGMGWAAETLAAKGAFTPLRGVDAARLL